jgi:hypothetical protein
VGDGRPPLQLRRLPLPPGHRLRRHGLRGRGGGTGRVHRLAAEPLEHPGGAGNVRVGVRRDRRVDRRPPPVA